MFCISIPEGPHIELEAMVREKNMWPVAGIDEVGRGALAGPVVVAAIPILIRITFLLVLMIQKKYHIKKEKSYTKRSRVVLSFLFLLRAISILTNIIFIKLLSMQFIML